MIEPRPEMSDRLATDLEASALQVELDEEAYGRGFTYHTQPVVMLNGLVTLEERTD